MKRNLYTLSLVLISVLAAQASVLNIRLASNAPFIVILDGKQVNAPDLMHRLDRVRPGTHQLRILQLPPNSRYYQNTRPIQIFNGRIRVQPNVEIFAVVDSRIGYRVTRVLPLPRPNPRYWYGGNQEDRSPEYDGYDYDGDQDYYGGRNNSLDYDEFDFDNNNYYYPNDPSVLPNRSNTSIGYVMPEREYNKLKQTVSNGTFESTKLAIAKQGISQNRLSVAQIKDLMLLFSFDKDRLDLAKYAYTYCGDTRNYYNLTEVFSFDSSKNDLLSFLQNQR